MPFPEESTLHMWDYWRDKKGYEEALQDYYPKTLAANLELQLALIQLKSAKALIDKFFENAEGPDDDS